jgi:hypothetical protein
MRQHPGTQNGEIPIWSVRPCKRHQISSTCCEDRAKCPPPEFEALPGSGAIKFVRALPPTPPIPPSSAPPASRLLVRQRAALDPIAQTETPRDAHDVAARLASRAESPRAATPHGSRWAGGLATGPTHPAARAILKCLTVSEYRRCSLLRRW